MSLIDRLEIVRKRAGLNKSQFERSLSVSTGYLKLTEKRQSQPGTELLIEFSKKYPDICLKWLLTGEGEMLKNDSNATSIAKETTEEYQNATLQSVHLDIKRDIHELAKGVTANFEAVSEGVLETLKGQQKILRFIETLDAKEISNVTSNLLKFLEQPK